VLTFWKLQPRTTHSALPSLLDMKHSMEGHKQPASNKPHAQLSKTKTTLIASSTAEG
jgi:hypothetical protein